MTLDDRDPRACLRRPEHPILLPLLLLLCLTATNRTHGRDCLSPRRVAPATATRPRPEPPLPPSRSRRTRIRTRTGTGNDPSPSSRRRKSKSSSSWPSAFRSSSSATVLRACDNNNNNNGSNDRRLTLRYHQRHLPKKIRQCRNDADKALAILGEAYPHYLACISTSRNPTRKEMEPHRHSLDFLQSILGDDDDKRNKKNTDEQDEGQPLVTIIDGKSISAVMEVLRKANDISTAWHLLRSSVDAVRTNRRVRKRTFQRLKPHPREHPDDEDDDDDRNELRQIYKSAISLLGNLPPPTTSEIPESLLWILDRHMPENGIVPEAEIYHAAVNALGKCGAHRHVAVLLERMERSRELSPSSSSSSVPRHGHSSTTRPWPTAPPVDKMAYQTAIASLSKSGNCRTATRFLRRMRYGGFPPDIGCYEALLIGIAKEAGRNANGEGKPETSKDDDAPWHRVALRILREMEWDYENGNTAVKPTRQTYDSVISACGKEGAWDEAARVARREAMWRFGSDDVVISKNGRFSTNALGKEGKTTVPFGCHNNVEHGSTIWNGEPRDAMSSYFQCLGCYRKVGKGKESWWEMGRYGIIEFDANANSDGKVSNRHMADCRLAYGDCVPPQNEVARTIKIGLQPHKNPVRNGISLVFYDEHTGAKLGRILLKNSSSKHEHGTNASNAAATSPPSSRSHYFSSLIGMEVNKSRRGEGLSKIFLAIWLRICLETDAFPRAAVMNKPLIALVLQRFGFVPRDGGVSVELIRFGTNDDDVVVDLDRGTTRHDQPKDDVGLSPSTESVAKFGLYSPHAKSLQGIFSQRVLRTQNIAILDHLSSTRSRGTTIHLKTTFEHPMAIEENVVDYNPPRVVDTNEYGGVSRGQRGSLSDGPLERRKLELKINEVLKIGKSDGIESTESYGLVEFFSSSSSLRHAFLSYASWFG